jgi:hypothetical protein
MRPKNPFSVIPSVCGESRKSLKSLDPPVKPEDDDIIAFVMYYIGLFMMLIYKGKSIIQHSSPL